MIDELAGSLPGPVKWDGLRVGNRRLQPIMLAGAKSRFRGGPEGPRVGAASPLPIS